MPQNQIAISLSSVDLKPSNTEFLKQHVWSRYNEHFLKMQQIIVNFMADYNRHPIIRIGYVCAAGDKATQENFDMTIGSLAPVQICVSAGPMINYTAPNEANDRDAVYALYDDMAAHFKNVMYESGGQQLVSQALFHQVRPLLGSILSAGDDIGVKVGLDRNPWGDQFEMVVFCLSSDSSDAIRILIRSPRIEAGEV